MNADANVAAFLSMIAHAEGTDKAPDPYRCCYSYKHTISSLADHPVTLGEWHGEPLPPAMCKAAGIASGKCRSTAAGRYQILVGTWRHLKSELQLPDFGPSSQDKAAIRLIKQQGALDDVRKGRIPEAIVKIRRTWASMPGAGVGQPERALKDLLRHYTSRGGQLEQ